MNLKNLACILLFAISSLRGSTQIIIKERFSLSEVDQYSSLWKQSLVYANSHIDSTMERKSKTALQIMSSNSEPPIFDSYFLISRYFPLTGDEKAVSLELGSRVKNCLNAFLKVTSFDVDENEIQEDSVLLVNNDNWYSERIRISLNGAKLLKVEISGNSVKDSVFSIWLDELTIRTERGNLENETEGGVESTILQKKVLDSEGTNNTIEMKASAGKHKIVGIGESIHGCFQFNQFALNMIKTLITNHQFSLVVFEKPFSEMCLWNLVLENGTYTDLKTIVNRTPILIDPDLLTDFLYWIKEYNIKHASNKVTLVGIDSAQNSIERYFIGEYINFLFQDENKMIKRTEMLVRLGQFNEAYAYVIQNRYELEKLIGSNHINNILHSFTLLKERDTQQVKIHTYIDFFVRRDEVMWKNLIYVLNSYSHHNNEKVVIYAHLSHLNKITTNESLFKKSLGWYISQRYDKNYFVCGLFGGAGTFSNYVPQKKGTLSASNNLEQPLPGSLEYESLNSGKSIFTAPTTSTNDLFMIRNIGNSNSLSWIYCNPQKRMDSFVFFSVVSGFNIPLSWKNYLEHPYKDLEQCNGKRIKELWNSTR